MPSWQARGFNAAVRVLVRRRYWGDERQLARRARRVFGTPAPLRRLYTSGLSITPVNEGDVRGEWLTSPSPLPGAILYMHGGGYISCSPATHRPITAALARLTGIPVFSLDYRLAPENRFPAALDDTIAAYMWLVENHDLAAERIAV